MPITDFLERNAQKWGDDVALVEINPANESRSNDNWAEFSLSEGVNEDAYRRELTWEDFDRRANRFAHLLMANNVKKGDKVAILLMNCLEWLPIYLGTLKAGAVAVPLNYRYTAEEISYCVDLSDATLLVFGREFTERVSAVREKMTKVRKYYYVDSRCPDFADSYYQFMSYCTSKKPPVEITEDDDAAIYFSSGTTGFPKAILHSHRSLTQAAEMEMNHHGQTHDDCFLCIPPLYHVGAKMHWFGSLISGGRAVLLRGVKPEWTLKAVSDEKCTIVWLLVPWAQDMLDAIDSGRIKLDDYELSQWRLMHIGAQPVPPSLIERWLKKFPHHDYDTNYGLSESAGPGCVHLGIGNTHKVGAIGIPGYRWKLKIIDNSGNALPQGEIGELAVTGPGVMKCYYKDEKATQEVLTADGWLRTGDMAFCDSDGFYWLVDRKKDIIIMGGENIYPVQIEAFMRGCEKIKDVAVIGLPDSRLGEISAAVIEVREGETLTEAEVNEFCLELPRYKRPREIIFDKVPRNATGKIEKPSLREKYGANRLVAQQVGIK